MASQSTEGSWYRVSFAGESPTCECAYNITGTGCRCKHIAAVEQALLISPEATLGRKVDVREQDLACPYCKEKRYSHDGWYRGKHEQGQGYMCTVCKRRARGQPGL